MYAGRLELHLILQKNAWDRPRVPNFRSCRVIIYNLLLNLTSFLSLCEIILRYCYACLVCIASKYIIANRGHSRGCLVFSSLSVLCFDMEELHEC